MLNEIDLSRADLNLLVLFETVLEEGHVGRAAERLNLSASAVSHGLGRLRRLLNDPLFLRTPKGVVPTARAVELAAPIADILSRIRGVVSTGRPFDPATSTRRFTLGAPDGVSAVFLPPFLAQLQRQAPGVDISIRQLLPSPARVWTDAVEQLEARAIEVAILPVDDVQARFAHQVLYEEDFVIAMRAGHAFGRDPTLERFCAMEHLLVSYTGDPSGFIDQILARQGLERRVALTVPNFMFALAVVAETDRLVAAIVHPLVDAIGHPTGRKLELRGPYEVNVERVIEAAVRTGTMIEINASPARRDLNDVHARAADGFRASVGGGCVPVLSGEAQV
jgi:DNA-binding transcriptional LysR family regulator